MIRRLILNILMGIAAWTCVWAAQPTGSTSLNIVDAINGADGTVYIYQPQSLDAIVDRNSAETGNDENIDANQLGYRILVFSDNNIRTAKAAAEHRKKLIEQQTEMRAYISYDSPYWRVRVGDFRTQTEADLAMRELKNQFPTIADDFRLVRERVNINP